jgi:hypothetical protein
MFTVHTISVIIILFFLLYNSIGKNGTITYKGLVDFKRRLDLKIVRWILSLKRSSFSKIDEALYRKLYYAPFFLFILAGVIASLFEPSKTMFYFVAVIILLTCVSIFGFLSSKRLFKSIRKFLKNALFFLGLAALVIIIALIDGERQLLMELYRALIKAPSDILYVSLHGINSEPEYPTELVLVAGISLFLGISLAMWIYNRLITKTTVIAFIAFAKFCFTLNNKSPLRPFYLIFQVSSIVLTEFILKTFN